MNRFCLWILISFLTSVTVISCRTSEENFRASYDKAISAQQQSDSIESTIYGRDRLKMNERIEITSQGEQVAVKSRFVRATTDGGGTRESIKKYNVVIGQFKQKFNAISLRNRVADAELPNAFVVETGEPYYYIVGASFRTLDEAVSFMSSMPDTLPMKEGFPFILSTTVK